MKTVLLYLLFMWDGVASTPALRRGFTNVFTGNARFVAESAVRGASEFAAELGSSVVQDDAKSLLLRDDRESLKTPFVATKIAHELGVETGYHTSRIKTGNPRRDISRDKTFNPQPQRTVIKFGSKADSLVGAHRV